MTPRFSHMPWIQLGEVDPAATLTPPPSDFPENTSAEQRASLRFGVSGNAVFTGGAGMLAITCARALLEHGLSGIALLDLPGAHEKAKSAIDSLRNDFPAATVLAAPCDVTDVKCMEDVVQQARDQLGDLTVLCCFAGMVYCGPAEDMPIDDWRKVLDVNTTGAWISAQVVGRHMIASKRGGKIVLISSISAHRANFPQPQAAYNASKAGIVNICRSLTAEWTCHGIRVNSISPGYMDTALNEGDQLEPWRRIWADRNPMRRMGSPQELTGPLVFLCSDIGGSYVNGVDLVVDGMPPVFGEPC